jgi:hypothetical protein
VETEVRGCKECGRTQSLQWRAGTCSSCYLKRYHATRSARDPAYKEGARLRARRNGRTAKGRWVKAKHKAETGPQRREFTLTVEEYTGIISKPCHYCSGPLPTQGSGLDRRDNRHDYHIWNVVPCCTTCNRAKGDHFTEQEWFVAIASIHGLRRARSAKAS